MFKKGLVTLVCLIVMSAVWSWATATYTVTTEINSLGTKLNAAGTAYEPVKGGSIKTRATDAADGVFIVALQELGIKGSTVTEDKDVEVEIAAYADYKIASVTKTTTEVLGAAPVTTTLVSASENLKSKTIVVDKPTIAGKTQYIKVTFTADTTSDVIRRTWQLQANNNNGGGSFTLTRAGKVEPYLTVGKPLVKNYIDTTPVTVDAASKPGYTIDYVVINGIKDQTDRKTFSMTVDGDPQRLNTFNFGYKKDSIQVTTHTATYVDAAGVTKFVDNGILPINPVVDPYGVVRLIVAPVGAKNQVTAISVNYADDNAVYPAANIELTDRFGDPVTLPSTGAVKIRITGITEAIKVGSSYGFDATVTAAAQNCTSTCHLDSSVPASVRTAATDWAASSHTQQSDYALDCVYCHQTMPGPNLNDDDAQEAICVTCHNATVTTFKAGHHGVASGHTSNTCARCHTTEGSVAGATYGWTGGYTAVLKPYSSSVWRNNKPAAAADGITCTACHDHNGLRSINTYNGTAVVAYDPNANGVSNDQYDVCTSCHTATDMYHEKSSMDAARIIGDSHADDAATGTTAAGTIIEGYVIRSTSANPCADCHNLHSADLTVQEEWAQSAHGGHIAKAKADAICAPALTWFNATYATNTATTCNDTKTVSLNGRNTTGTVSELYGKTADGIAALKAAGATDATGIAWTHYNWDQTSSRGACQRCHTATGSANFLKNPAGYDATGNGNDFSHLSGWTKAAGSPQQEMLYCWGCHSDSQSGALQDPGALTLDYSAASNDTVVYADVDKSNVCVACHSGNGGSGDSIANSTGDFATLSAIQPHYLAAAGVLMTGSTNGGTGYEFAGVTYTKNGIHQKIGSADFYGTGTEGPCVACHMSGAEKHTFEVSAASAVCVNCHAGLTDEAVEAAKTAYENSLVEFDNALKGVGIYFIPSYPYFVSDNGCVPNATGSACESYDAAEAGNGTLSAGEQHRANGLKNWTTQVPAGNGKDTMGAAFNFNLLVHEPGAFAHNKAYTYELIQTSLDYLADGAVDGNGVNAVVAAAAASEEFAAATSHAAAIVATPTPSSTCDDCHTPAPHYGGNAFLKAQYVSTTSQPVTCANCHGTPADATAYQTILGQYADSAHAAKDAEAWIHYDWRTANRSACARCHNGTAFVAKLGDANDTTNVFADTDVLKPGETLACSACHTDAAEGELRTPSTSFTINMKNGATAEYTVAGASALCARCHSGRETGDSIKADVAADGPRAFIDSHYLPVTGTLYNNGGYEYAGQSYDSLGSHKTLGASGNGPCVSCHMAGGNHSFAAASCASCHGDTVNAATQKATYDAALNGLKLALQAKGIHYGPVHPFFFTAPYVPRGDNVPVTNWAIGGANWKDVMGAAFNYNMLWSDKGAYAHNYAYAMKLIEDSTAFIGTVVLP